MPLPPSTVRDQRNKLPTDFFGPSNGFPMTTNVVLVLGVVVIRFLIP